MYKKLLSSLAALGTVAVTAASVVSCTPIQYADGEDGQRVVTVTDGGHINDHSFNEDALRGVRDFVNDAFGLPGKNDYVESGGTDITSIVSGYKLAIMKKTNAVVMPGFIHMNSMGQVMDVFAKHNINTVLVDGTFDNDRVISITFNSQISGFMAGFDTSYLFGTSYKDADGKLTTDASKAAKSSDDKYKLFYDTNNDNEIRIGTFAGATNKYGVDNYMWGLWLGMAVYNKIAESNPDWVPVKSANTSDGKIESIKPISKTDTNYWSNSYALGDANKAGITNRLINANKADVIFPVAGPQIQDIITAKISDDSWRKPYLIGVDVDQQAAYPEAADRFITSAIKNIHTAVPEALYRAESEDGKIKNSLNKDLAKDAESKAKFESGDKWLGRKANDFGQRVDWSIDYTNEVLRKTYNDPNYSKYILDHNFITLFNQENNMDTAKNAMWDINKFFEKLDANDPMKYLLGDPIVKFADDLVKNYGEAFKDGRLDWNKKSNKSTKYDMSGNGYDYKDDWSDKNPGLTGKGGN